MADNTGNPINNNGGNNVGEGSNQSYATTANNAAGNTGAGAASTGNNGAGAASTGNNGGTDAGAANTGGTDAQVQTNPNTTQQAGAQGAQQAGAQNTQANNVPRVQQQQAMQQAGQAAQQQNANTQQQNNASTSNEQQSNEPRYEQAPQVQTGGNAAQVRPQNAPPQGGQASGAQMDQQQQQPQTQGQNVNSNVNFNSEINVSSNPVEKAKSQLTSLNGGWYQLSDGKRVQGEQKAIIAQIELDHQNETLQSQAQQNGAVHQNEQPMQQQAQQTQQNGQPMAQTQVQPGAQIQEVVEGGTIIARGPSDPTNGAEVLRFTMQNGSILEIRSGQILTAGKDISVEDAQQLLNLSVWTFEKGNE